MKLTDLPDDIQKELMCAFEITECMDLYQGDIFSYLCVIKDRLLLYKTKYDRLREQVEQMKRIINEI